MAKRKKVRVLIYGYEYPPLGGGAANSADYLLREFSKDKELEIDFVTAAPGFYFRKTKKYGNVRLHFLPVRLGWGRSLQRQKVWDMAFYTLVAFGYTWRLILGGENYDLTHFMGYPGGLVSWMFSWKWKYVVSLWGIEVPGYSEKYRRWYPVYKLVVRLVWSRASRVVAISEGIGELARRSWPGLAYEVITNGVETKLYKPVSKRKKYRKFTVTAGGTILGKIKGIEYLIRGFAAFAREWPASRLWLVGDGDEKENLAQLAQQLGVEGQVKFLGRRSKRFIQRYLPRCQVLCLPSLNEGMSNAVLEGMACGLPVVITNTGGRSEVFEENGLVVPKRNAKSIYRALVKLRKNEERRRLMGKKSRKLALKFGWARVAREYKKVYV